MNVLMVEDDTDLSRFVRQGLEEEGFTVDTAIDGASGLRCALAARFDLIILDLMLPEKDGLTLCREVREANVHTPVLMLTARDSVEDRVRGLEAGADDYLTKPFSFEELLARVHAQIRRSQDYGSSPIRVANLEIDPVRRVVTQAGVAVDLTVKEFALLEYLARNTGTTVTDRDILSAVWGLDFDPGTNIVHVYVHHLRAKLDQGQATRLLHTVRGRGYVLEERPS